MYSAAATDRCTNAVRGAQLGVTKGGASAHSRGPIGRVVISVDKEVLPRWMRGKLLRNHDTCPLFDTARFTRHIEADYAATWRAHGDGRAPAALAVEA
jgi:hypothetical protein